MSTKARLFLGIFVIFFLIMSLSSFGPARAQEILEEPELNDEDWLAESVGGIEADQEKLTNNIQDIAMPLYFLENYLAEVLPAIAEPGDYKINSLPTREGLFEIEDIEQVSKQFEEQPEDWEEGDDWQWNFQDDERYVEINLTSRQIDFVEEPGKPLLSRLILDLEYYTPDYEVTGIIHLYDDFDDLDFSITLEHYDAAYDKVEAEISMDLLDRVENRFSFSGDMYLPGLNVSGQHQFIFTDRPLELPRTKPLYLDEFIFNGYIGSESFAIEGDLWICRSSIVMDGYTVIY